MKKIFFLIFLCGSVYSGFGQTPVHWGFQARKLSPGKYELHLKAEVNPPWHTYSQTTPAGGPLPTHIVLVKSPLIVLEGKTKEVGQMKTVHDATFGVDIWYFDDTVDFVQVIRVKGNAKMSVKGTVEYMVCNDHECLAPETVPFTISLP